MQMVPGIFHSIHSLRPKAFYSQSRRLSTVHPFYEAKDEELKDAKEYLNQFKAGKILLNTDDDSGIATITIDNPDRKNGISGSMMVDLSYIVDYLAEWTGKALLIHGSNNFFSSGGDLNTIRSLDSKEGGRKMGLLLYETFRRFTRLPLITVALIQGRAIGFGAEIATACDFRLMAESAKIGYVHINLNIAPISGGATRLVHIIGANRALEMMTSGRQLSAQEALEFGLINAKMSDDNSMQESLIWLNKHIHGSPEIVASIKKMVKNAQFVDYQDSIAQEYLQFQRVWANPMSIRAFSSKIKHY